MTLALRASAPGDAGIPRPALETFLSALDDIGGVHGVVVLKGGAVVATAEWHPYRVDEPHTLFSVSKSVTSLAVGLAVAEGRFALDDRVVDLLPDDAPADPDPRLSRLRVEHLLTMTSGHTTDTVEPLGRVLGRTEQNWSRAILALPLDIEPGTRFAYDSGATYLLSAIVQRSTGQTLTEYLEPRIFAPLGIASPTWERCPRGIETGGWGLSLRTTEMALLGQLLLQRGSWEGSQLVPAEWIDAATTAQVECRNDDLGADWAQGYGYQFWRSQHGAYRADGAWGQYIVVWPEFDLVIAMTAGEPHMELQITAIWDSLLGRLRTPAALPDGEPVSRDDLRIPLPKGTADGVLPRRYAATANSQAIETVAVSPGSDGGAELSIGRAGRVERIRALHDEWSEAVSAVGGAEEPIAAAYAVEGDGTVRVDVLFTRTAFRWAIRLAADGGSIEHTVAFGPLLVAELTRADDV